MSVSDEVIIMGIGMLFNYILLYTKHKLLGSIMFLIIGIVVMMNLDSNAGNAIGLIIIAVSLVSAIYEFGKRTKINFTGVTTKKL